jgi:hypothetical protein
MTRAARLLIAAALAVFGLLALWLSPPGPSLDLAQEKFEHSARWPTPADFNTWRAAGSLKCRDIPSLRICEASWPLFSPADGKPFDKDRVTFACSPEVCAWVDP